MLLRTRTAHWSNVMFQLEAEPALGAWRPELYISCVGSFFSYGDFQFQQISRCCALHLIESGRGVFEMNGRAFEAGPGDAFCFFPGKHVRYFDFPAEPWRFSWLHLGGAKAKAALAEAGISEASPKASGGLRELLDGFLKELTERYAKPDVDPACAAGAAWRLLELLRGARRAPARNATAKGVAEAAKYLIDNHVMGVLAVDEIARQLQCERSSLFRKFKAAYGLSPKAYLERVRLEAAKRLLLETSSSAKAVAELCGYKGEQYFCRAFKARTGLPPAAWRARRAARS